MNNTVRNAASSQRLLEAPTSSTMPSTRRSPTRAATAQRPPAAAASAAPASTPDGRAAVHPAVITAATRTHRRVAGFTRNTTCQFRTFCTLLRAGRGAAILRYHSVACSSGPCCSESACSRAVPASVPGEGGPPWSEWTTPHFRVVTDLPDDEAEAAGDAFEELRAALVAAAWRRAPEPHTRLEVVILRDPGDLAAFMPQRYIGGFIADDALGAVMVTYGGVALINELAVKHEIVHALSYQLGTGANEPRWVGEGIAEYLSTVRYARDHSQVVFGDIHPHSGSSSRHGECSSSRRSGRRRSRRRTKRPLLRHCLAAGALPLQIIKRSASISSWAPSPRAKMPDRCGRRSSPTSRAPRWTPH